MRKLMMTGAVSVALFMTVSGGASQPKLVKFERKERVAVTQIDVPNSIVENKKLPKGASKKISDGKAGAVVVTYSQVYAGGKLIKEAVVKKTRIEPVAAIYQIGPGGTIPKAAPKTAPKPEAKPAPKPAVKTAPSSRDRGPSNSRGSVPSRLAIAGKKVAGTSGQSELQMKYASMSKYKLSEAKVMTMESTAYLPTDGSAAGLTATGRKARRGIVAVDPRVIPMNSLVYVEGYGWAVAADTGGAIKGNIVDVCIENRAACMTWGRRNVKVFIFPQKITSDLPGRR